MSARMDGGLAPWLVKELTVVIFVVVENGLIPVFLWPPQTWSTIKFGDHFWKEINTSSLATIRYSGNLKPGCCFQICGGWVGWNLNHPTSLAVSCLGQWPVAWIGSTRDFQVQRWSRFKKWEGCVFLLADWGGTLGTVCVYVFSRYDMMTLILLVLTFIVCLYDNSCLTYDLQQPQDSFIFLRLWGPPGCALNL